MQFQREKIKAGLALLARQGIYLGTSSWKYAGWRGQLYEDDRYIYRGRFSEKRFENFCLTEYAEIFKTVCVDGAYYNFPSSSFVENVASQVPADFRFGFKVTDQITLKRFPNLPRFGRQADALNPNFLNAELFDAGFLEPLRAMREKVGLLIFEFSRFSIEDFPRGRDFAEVLEKFLSVLPKGWPYGVEIRNRTFLHDDFFQVLARHDVAYVYNSWQDMPPLDEQIAMASARTSPELTGARLLLRPGRKYEDAVKMFKPYSRIQDAYPEGRAAGLKLMQSVIAAKGRIRALIFVNNRFEGNALETIAAMVSALGSAEAIIPTVPRPE
jgi:uncharacterized protein YecE (DUF72 family)